MRSEYTLNVKLFIFAKVDNIEWFNFGGRSNSFTYHDSDIMPYLLLWPTWPYPN